jgi:hypothetical protein
MIHFHPRIMQHPCDKNAIRHRKRQPPIAIQQVVLRSGARQATPVPLRRGWGEPGAMPQEIRLSGSSSPRRASLCGLRIA